MNELNLFFTEIKNLSSSILEFFGSYSKKLKNKKKKSENRVLTKHFSTRTKIYILIYILNI